MIPDGEAYFVWSHEHSAWWRPNRRGYTQKVIAAGRYSRAEAIEICRGARNGFSIDAVPSEIPVPERDILEIQERPA